MPVRHGQTPARRLRVAGVRLSPGAAMWPSKPSSDGLANAYSRLNLAAAGDGRTPPESEPLWRAGRGFVVRDLPGKPFTTKAQRHKGKSLQCCSVEPVARQRFGRRPNTTCGNQNLVSSCLGGGENRL